MAEELRGVQYHDSSATDLDGVKLIENTADKSLFVRNVTVCGFADNNGTAGGGYFIQIGKNNAYNETDYDPGHKLQAFIGAGDQATTGSGSINKDWYRARGQLELEPGEVLYYNKHEVGTVDACEIKIQVDYHY